MTKNEKTQNLDRRDFLAGLLAGASVITLAPLEGLAQADGSANALELNGIAQASLPTDLDGLFHYIQPGVGVIDGWKIHKVSWEEGAVRVSISDIEDNQVIMDICRRQGKAEGVEHTDHLDFIVMNDGGGKTWTQTPAHQAVRIIREVLGRMDVDTGKAVAMMRTHAERRALTDAGILRFG